MKPGDLVISRTACSLRSLRDAGWDNPNNSVGNIHGGITMIILDVHVQHGYVDDLRVLLPDGRTGWILSYTCERVQSFGGEV